MRGSAGSSIVLILRRIRQQAPAVLPASTPPAWIMPGETAHITHKMNMAKARTRSASRQ
jgi:hypothetical protein